MADAWQLGPFTPDPREIALRGRDAQFRCPVAGVDVEWAAKDVFNPGAVVHEGRVHLLVRAEDAVGRYSGTSRIGLAISDDGQTFDLEPEPVLFPSDDEWQPWEWPGGCEDPRVVESPEGGFVATYTAFDGKVGRLFVATSDDLRRWVKRGAAFASTAYALRSSKSGSVVTELRDGRLVAARLWGQYWMYWGEGTCFAATSDDLIKWTPVEFDAGRDRFLTYDPSATQPWGIQVVPGQRVLRPLLFPRPHRFDSLLVEPGPPALVTRDGIVLIYNGANHFVDGDPNFEAMSYQPAQALFDAVDPASCIARDAEPFLTSRMVDAREGQTGNVCFAQSLVVHDGRCHLYVGLADSRIGHATAPLVTR